MTQESTSAHTAGPWSQGRTLLTPQTKRWSKEEWDANELFEKQVIFAHFTAKDEGRGRQPIAQVMQQSPEWEANARLISAAPELLAICKEVMDREFAQDDYGAFKEHIASVISKAS